MLVLLLRLVLKRHRGQNEKCRRMVKEKLGCAAEYELSRLASRLTGRDL